MSIGVVDMKWTLDADQLKAIKIAVRGKLRAAHFKDAFIREHFEDVMQQALTEYTRAQQRGIEIPNPAGWIVYVAHMRAIDQLRKEKAHEVDEISDDFADETTPLPEEEALGHIEADQLHRAMTRLSVSQRKALSLYYFEEQTTRQAAESLGWSEPTFRRRRDAAIRSLRERLGVSVPEFDIGLAAWLSLTFSDGRFASITSNLASAAETVRSGTLAAVDRGRDFAARLLSSGGGETAIGISSPAGKAAAGVCATAIAACTATGVIGPGVGGIDLIDKNTSQKPPIERQAAEQMPVRPTPVETGPPPTDSPAKANASRTTTRNQTTSERDANWASAQKEKTKRARQQAASQFSVESEAASSTPTTTAPSPSTTPSPSPASTPTPDQSAQQQFGLP